MKIVGIHDGHNSAVCLLDDGKIKGLMQEERVRFTKNYAGFPAIALKKLLHVHDLSFRDIDVFAFSGEHMPPPEQNRSLLRGYQSSYTTKAKINDALKRSPVYKIYKKRTREKRISTLLEHADIDSSRICFVEHHMAHAAAAYFGCPWVDKNEKTLILTQDGAGDGLSGTVNIGHEGKIKRVAAIKKEDSLGRIYATVTFMLGMVPLEHEYKLMGMAPYAPAGGRQRSYEVFKNLLHFPEEDSVVWKRKSGLPPMQMIYPHLRQETEFHRFDWLAAGLQQFTEEMLVRWVRNCIRRTGIRRVVMSGGTFMNVKANQRVYEMPEVEKLFIFPSCGDESNSLGAAWHIHHTAKPQSEIIGMQHLYHGLDETGKSSCLKWLDDLKMKSSLRFKYSYHDEIESRIAELLAAGEIVARCKGPMEFGARALGNRSILADAGDLEKISIINNMIKKRDFWMPFAPVMLRERSGEYIKNPRQMEAPFMIVTFDTTDKYREFIGGVQQVDHTARPQIIDEKLNRDYYAILKEYEQRTGKGVLINTSFNLHGQPIVYGPKEALYVFENSGIQHLALGNFLVQKEN